jgi:hypothetical protein
VDLDKARALARARAYGLCEGCRQSYGRGLDPHHRKARGSGGVHRTAAVIANDIRNILALCRPCHDMTEAADTWSETEGKGWRVPSWGDPFTTPALIHTVNGYGWWLLTESGGYQWVDLPLHWRVTHGSDPSESTPSAQPSET